jgi:uncharacterized membrane protein YdjX (TVP38/TMEM64 family)
MPKDSLARPCLPLSPRHLALIPLALAVVGLAIFLLPDAILFEAQRENRERLLACWDANDLVTAVGYMLYYVKAIALSLPGGAVTTLSGVFASGSSRAPR